MQGVLHVSFRVNDPQRSAELFAELIDGQIKPTPLDRWGVVCVYPPGERESWLMDMLEFWPADKHWKAGKLETVDPTSQKFFGHIAFYSNKTFDELEPIAKKHGLLIREEERAVGAPVPVLYDDCGNYFEFFPASLFEAASDA